MAHWPRDAPIGAGCTPWFHPGAHALFEILYDPFGDPRIDVDAIVIRFPAHDFLLHFSEPRLSRSVTEV
jgi:hypothetical protein